MNDSRGIFMARIAAIACAIAVTVAVPLIEASGAAADSGDSGVVTPQPTPNYDPWV
jgi:hypothetical protein